MKETLQAASKISKASISPISQDLKGYFKKNLILTLYFTDGKTEETQKFQSA